MKSNVETEKIIQFLLDNDLAATYFDPGKREQMIKITKFGADINEILDHMRKEDNV